MLDQVDGRKSEMTIDIRVPPQLTTTQVIEQTQKIVAKYQESNPKVLIKSTINDTVEPFEVNKTSPLVHTLSAAVRKVLNKPATLLRKTGTGDMNILGKAMNLPIVTYGPGDSHLDHTIEEHIVINEYLASIQIYKDTLLKLAELHKNKKNAEQQ
jgi:LysW-gamma-L-lysine carboxypeptidase